MSELKDDLYQKIIASPLSVHGVEDTLPALEQLIKELRREGFWEDKKHKHRLSEEQMIRAWAAYREDLQQLRERMRQQQYSDELLSWLVMFLIEHAKELARTSVLDVPSFQEEIDYAASQRWETPEHALVMRPDWQQWAVEFLRDALRDPDLDAGTTAASGSQGGNGDLTTEPGLKPKPASDETGLEY